ncbi:MlaD family protein [Chitinophaga japonensis]|uniref:Phospholipid/cholesterol/gamma-HCH transport system substrate-binding protein n=1 Tax=Chitinophaga japonensis TaxID=104662 RepID=A0A562T0D6_CHIJA|nr:MlaD family protein [Chitinophaga japonensis]TWI86724.1 phospholipid/cholesterol/gamma-HCH transport system substrate-binding protein [Chitinophaga japonensis]
MESTTTRRSVTVGIFIFLGLIIFAVAVLVLGGQKKAFMQAVEVKTIFRDVGGLSKGNNVWYAGVKVGTIKSIRFLDHRKIEVEMHIDKSYRRFIHKDVRARVSSDGLVGNKIISLGGGTDQAAPIEDGDVLAAEISISSDEIMNTLQVNNKNLVDITANLKDITANIREGQGTLGKLLTDTAVYDQLAGTLANLQRSAANAQRLTNSLAGYTARLRTEGTLANELVTDTLVFSKLRSTATGLEEAMERANEAVGSLQEASAGINRQLNSSQSAAGVILHDTATARNLKATIQNLESSTYKLDQNMEALKHNFLFRGYFRRLEKQQRKEQEQ